MSTQVNVSTPAPETTSNVSTGNGKRRSDKVLWPVPENKDDKLELEVGASDFAFPAGYDPEKHKPLRAAHFKSKPSYFTFRAIMAQRDADRYRKEATDWKTNAGRKKLDKKLEAHKKRINDLKEQMAKLGMTPEEIAAALS